MHTCYNCGARWESSLRQPAVKETCTACGAYLHCCRNCTHYVRGYPNDCFIPDTEKIADKSHTNFCDEYEFISQATILKRLRKRGSSDASLDTLLGATTARDEESEVKEWLQSADKPKQDFDDLFNE